MCGIIAGSDRTISSYQLSESISTISNRGPDLHNILRIDERVFIVFSLLGLSHSDSTKLIQPFQSNNITVCVNGEIYNYGKLKDDLIARGAKFITESDCEVVLHGLEIYGADFLEKINGEFAIVAYYHNSDTWLCAVDHVGTKPLRYVVDKEKFLIASSSIALKKLGIDLALEPSSCLFSMHTQCLPSGETLFTNIKSIPPGHYIQVKDGQITLFSYKPKSFLESDDVEFLFEQAISCRIPEYFRPALTLSGGVDSCAIAIYLRKLGVEFDCYSIDFKDSEYSETEDIERFCKNHNIRTNVITMSEKDIMQLYPQAVINSENISINPHAAGKLKINRIISNSGHRVCFTGDGSDELFLGYSHFHTNDQYQFLRDSTMIGSQFSQLVLPEYRQKLLTSNLFSDYAGISLDPSAQDLYYHYWLNEYGLKILGDSQSANERVEYRYPFLDVNLISNIRKHDKLREINYPSKQMLRNIIQDPDVATRKKRPFTAPFIGKNWMPLFEEYVFNTDLIVLDQKKTQRYIETLGSNINSPSKVILSQILSLGIIKKELCDE